MFNNAYAHWHTKYTHALVSAPAYAKLWIWRNTNIGISFICSNYTLHYFDYCFLLRLVHCAWLCAAISSSWFFFPTVAGLCAFGKIAFWTTGENKPKRCTKTFTMHRILCCKYLNFLSNTRLGRLLPAHNGQLSCYHEKKRMRADFEPALFFFQLLCSKH